MGWSAGINLTQTTLLRGNGPPAPTLGVAGNFYIDEQNLFYYGQKTDAGWTTTPSSIAGSSGPIGATGPTGTGAQGAAGLSLLSGSGPPAASLGVVGQPGYLDTANTVLYPQKTGATWGTGVSLVGATGSAASATANVVPFGYYWNQSYTAPTYYQTQRTVQSASGTNGAAGEAFTWPFAGQVLACSFSVAGTAAGDAYGQVYKNGSAYGNAFKVVSGANAQGKISFAANTYSYAANDTMTLYVASTASGNLQLLAYLTLQMATS